MSFLIGEASNYAGLNVLLTVCALVVSLICAFGVFWLSQRASERDRQRHEEQVLQKRKEDQWATAIDSLKQKLDGASLEGKQLAEKLIDERLRAASHEVNNHVQGFVTGMELLKSQMNEWAQDVKELAKDGTENQLSMANQLGHLKDWMRDTFADKTDLKTIDEHMRGLETKVAVLHEKVEAMQP
jgi:hypothetical protein